MFIGWLLWSLFFLFSHVMYMISCWCFGSMGGLFYTIQVVELLVHIMVGWGEPLGVAIVVCLSTWTPLRWIVKKCQKTGVVLIIPIMVLCWGHPAAETSPWVLSNGLTFNYWWISLHMACRVDQLWWIWAKCAKNQSCVNNSNSSALLMTCRHWDLAMGSR